MPKFNVSLSQVLDDGDTALVEHHTKIEEHYVQDIIDEYTQRSMAKSYVASCTMVIERLE